MVLNFAVILLAVLIWSLFHEGMANLHAKIFGITREEAKVTFFRIVQQYRLAVAFLNVVPYRAGPHGSDNRSLELGDFFCILLVSTLAKGAEDEP